MTFGFLAITTLHIILLAVCAFLIALLILLFAIFSGGKKKHEDENPDDVSLKTPSATAQEPSEAQPQDASASAAAAPPTSAPAEEVREAEEPAAREEAAVSAGEVSPLQEKPEEDVPPAEEFAAPEERADEPQPAAGLPDEAVEGNAAVSDGAPAQTAIAEKTAPAAAAADKPARVVYTDEDGWFVRIRYDKSFEAKLIQGDGALKEWYSALRNELLSYRKVSARRSWQHEAFRLGRGTVAKLVIRGKTLRLYLALDPSEYIGSKYLVEDASEHAKFEKTPLLYRIRSERRCRYAKELIAAAVEAAGGQRGEAHAEDFASLPFESTQALIDRGLVRIVEVRRRASEGAGGTELLVDEEDLEDDEPADVRESEEAPAPAPLPDPAAEHRVSVAAAEQLMADDEALVLPAEQKSDTYRQTIVNIDTLGEYFADGERVTIEEMRERIPFFDKRATAVKVLARGVLNKTLEVEADDYSLAAVKMILLLGGKAYVRGK